MKKTKYILRLDDASPYMAREKWRKTEYILDKYKIKPIVGIVPDCTDDFIKYDAYDSDFFNVIAARWQRKNWTIAQHGLHHSSFFKKDGKPTEFATLPYDKQFEMICRGYELLSANGIKPVCFFAPFHSFDDNTVRACHDAGVFHFISDGCSRFPYTENDMIFLPNLFDTPKHISLPGVYTFVCHPSNTDDAYFNFLDDFLNKNYKNFINADEFVSRKQTMRHRNAEDILIAYALNQMRKKRKRE